MRIALYGLIIISHIALAMYVGHNIGYDKGFFAGKTDVLAECRISLENLTRTCKLRMKGVFDDCIRYSR